MNFPATLVLRLRALRACIAVVVLGAGVSSAQNLSGTVKNGTSGKPGAGDEIVLLSLGQGGMTEAGRTKADPQGHFSFKLDGQGPHLIRAIHQGVTYHRMAPPGTDSVEVSVYDVDKKVPDIAITADVVRLQADAGTLQGIRLFAVNNNSSPPRTQMNDQNLEFYLPDGATVQSAMAKSPGGQPIASSPVPQKEKNRYAFIFPLRPGETQFQVEFRMPYSGQLGFDPKPFYPAQHFVVMLPKTMQFTATAAASYQSLQDPQQSDAVVQVASNTKVGQQLAFQVSGTGTLQGDSDQQQGGAQSGPETARPGGGLGPPIEAPDPLDKYRWYILGGVAVLMAGGAFYIAKRSKTAVETEPAEVEILEAPAAKPAPASAPSSPGARSALLLEALKEELFQLEIERKLGHISEPDYNRAKAALDQTLERALRREAAKVN